MHKAFNARGNPQKGAKIPQIAGGRLSARRHTDPPDAS